MQQTSLRKIDFVDATQRFFSYLPVLVISFSLIRTGELIAADGLRPEVIAQAIIQDSISLLRFLPGLFVISLLPLLFYQSRLGPYFFRILWTLVLCVHALLVQYYLIAGVPLGSDSFAYSASELDQTIRSSIQLNPIILVALLVSIIHVWISSLNKRYTVSFKSSILLITLSGLSLFILPAQSNALIQVDYNGSQISLNKSAYFYDESLQYFINLKKINNTHTKQDSPINNSPKQLLKEDTDAPLDPKHPFLHEEKTFDELGPYFNINNENPPNFVFIIVEGLGRNFSGPDARLGSFTPFLDSLIAKSLYWDNFLATQGRTFGVLPSIFSSAPFGQHGFANQGRELANHHSLLNILKQQGYHTRFYSGADPKFDNEKKYLLSQKIDKLFGKDNFDKKYKIDNYWGFSDKDLMKQVIEEESKETYQPFVSIVQTVTMHSPFSVAGESSYDSLAENYFKKLISSGNRYINYEKDKEIYKTILYTDDALRYYFSLAEKLTSFSNTIFVITGDHLLPEIEMDTVIERYHVPLIIYSPLLKQSERIKSVSSHFDIAPSLLAFLSNNYGIKTPKMIAWLGDGLDLEPSFRNLHSFPLKQTKSNLVDYIHKEWFINHDALYKLHDGLNIEPINDELNFKQAKAKFDEFVKNNDSFSISGQLFPNNLEVEMIAYDHIQRIINPDISLDKKSIITIDKTELTPPPFIKQLGITSAFKNIGGVKSEPIAPLFVISDAHGKEIKEIYGQIISIEPHTEKVVTISSDISELSSGEYFISIIPSHPYTGKPVGTGRYHLPFIKQTN